ncbi:MAG: hypothetical protein QXT66_08245 [Nitrososphaerota archaeon]
MRHVMPNCSGPFSRVYGGPGSRGEAAALLYEGFDAGTRAGGAEHQPIVKRLGVRRDVGVCWLWLQRYTLACR